MYLYIDALFNVRNTNNPSVVDKMADGLSTTDEEKVKNSPPFMTGPKAIMIALSTGGVYVFEGDDTSKLLTDMHNFVDTLPLAGNECFVGWNLDRVIFPSIAANSMITGAKSIPRIMRKLDDKWSKTNGVSLERAFWQGWYRQSSSDEHQQDLTLDIALDITGMESVAEIRKKMDTNTSATTGILMARLSAISKLHTRYHNLIT